MMETLQMRQSEFEAELTSRADGRAWYRKTFLNLPMSTFYYFCDTPYEKDPSTREIAIWTSETVNGMFLDSVDGASGG